MDYEKKYKEALEKAKFYYDNWPLENEKNKLENIFPELRESEDERTRKRAIAILKQQRDYWSYDGPIDKFPPATPRKDLVDAIDVAISYLEKQKEQKPAEWSEEDNNMWTHLNGYLNGFSCSEDAIKQMADWFYELPNRFNLQPKQEWSEEDEKKVSSLLAMLTTMRQLNSNGSLVGIYSKRDREKKFDEIENWLKSLRPRPSWKPSEEQMSALLWCIAHLGGADRRVLAELYEHLKMYCK